MYETTKSEIVRNGRDSFRPFYIVNEEEYSSDIISAIRITAVERLNGANGMRQVTLAEIESKFGRIEAQAVRLETLKSKTYKPPTRDIAVNMTVWTEHFVVQISSNEMWEWLTTVPRNPDDYK